MALDVQDVYLSVEGAKQGKITGGSHHQGKGWRDASECVAFDYPVQAPFDSNSGSLSGKRQHLPVVVRKKKDLASPKLAHAWTMNEILKDVKIYLRRGEKERHVIKLTNAVIANIRNISIPGVQGPCEQVEFSYDKVEKTLDFGRR
jgi:type VI secretion system Hcp family effector